MALTNREGADSAIEAIGHRGENPAPLHVFGLDMNAKAIHTGLWPGGGERMRRLLRYRRPGRIDPTPMTTHRLDCSGTERAVWVMEHEEDGIVKPLIAYG